MCQMRSMKLFLLLLFTCLIPLPCSSLLPAHSGRWPEDKTRKAALKVIFHSEAEHSWIHLTPSQYQPAPTRKSQLW